MAPAPTGAAQSISGAVVASRIWRWCWMTHSSARADGTYDKLFDKFGMTKLKATTFAIRGDGPTN
jgi:hypothetical protein